MRPLAVLALLVAPLAHAQSAFVLPQIPSSTAEATSARAATLPASGDPHEAVLNPAVLGAMSGLRVSRSGSSAWLGLEDIEPTSLALTYGTEVTSGDRPLSVGVGLYRGVMSFDLVPVTGQDPTSAPPPEQNETASGLGVGVRWGGPVVLSGGAAVYARRSPDYLPGSENDVAPYDRATTLDLGLLAEVPLVRANPAAGEVRVPFGLALGAARRNMALASDLPERTFLRPDGGTNAFQGAVPDHETVLGGGPRLAVVQGVEGGALTLFSLDSRVEREWASVELGRGREDIDLDGVRLATELSLLETVVVRGGLFLVGDEIQSDRVGAGASLRIDGLLRTIGAFSGDAALRSVGERLTFRLDYATFDIQREGPFDNTTFTGVTLGWRP